MQQIGKRSCARDTLGDHVGAVKRAKRGIARRNRARHCKALRLLPVQQSEFVKGAAAYGTKAQIELRVNPAHHPAPALGARHQIMPHDAQKLCLPATGRAA